MGDMWLLQDILNYYNVPLYPPEQEPKRISGWLGSATLALNTAFDYNHKLDEDYKQRFWTEINRRASGQSKLGDPPSPADTPPDLQAWGWRFFPTLHDFAEWRDLPDYPPLGNADGVKRWLKGMLREWDQWFRADHNTDEHDRKDYLKEVQKRATQATPPQGGSGGIVGPAVEAPPTTTKAAPPASAGTTPARAVSGDGLTAPSKPSGRGLIVT